MMHRRNFIIGTGAAAVAVACTPSAGSVTIAAQGAAGMNTAPDGSDRPVTLQVIQMRGTAAFDGADFFALQNPAGALGGDFIKADTIVVPPGGKVTKTVALDPTAVAVGVVAGFLQPGGKTFRAKSSVSPTAKSAFAVSLGAGGMTFAPA
jgi:type VI secretion system protein VasD